MQYVDNQRESLRRYYEALVMKFIVMFAALIYLLW